MSDWTKNNYHFRGIKNRILHHHLQARSSISQACYKSTLIVFVLDVWSFYVFLFYLLLCTSEWDCGRDKMTRRERGETSLSVPQTDWETWSSSSPSPPSWPSASAPTSDTTSSSSPSSRSSSGSSTRPGQRYLCVKQISRRLWTNCHFPDQKS